MMKRGKLLVIVLVLLVSHGFALTGDAAGYDGGWDIAGEILRLGGEVPSTEAFGGGSGVVWLDSHIYEMKSDGTAGRTRRYIVMPAGEHERASAALMIQPYPQEPGASLVVSEAAMYDPSTAERIGDLSVVRREGDGVGAAIVSIPPGCAGGLAVIETVTEIPGRFFLDDVIPLAGDLPAWEQNILVEMPEGMNMYWEGVGVREPHRRKEAGVERLAWTVINQPAWRKSSIVEETRPMLIFSQRRGLMRGLKDLEEAEGAFTPPPVPSNVRGSLNLIKTGSRIAEHLSERRMVIDGYEPDRVRTGAGIPPDGPWTSHERTIIAGRWLRELGWDVKVYWMQKLPVGPDGPSSSGLWDKPLLRITQNGGGKDVYFTADQSADFGKLSPSLYGRTAFRVDGTNLERPTLPRGTASDHNLSQMWRLNLDEKGIATGSLDLTITGAWVDALLRDAGESPDDLAGALLGEMEFGVPGLSIELVSCKNLSSGYKFSFDVRTQLGIVSGNDMLVRIPGGKPRGFDDVPADAESFSFEFPFVFEQDAVISTPAGYKALMLPGSIQNGDSKAMFTESVEHWVRKGRVEASAVWTVRSVSVDSTTSGKVREQLNLAGKWSQTTIPLRK
ncbi:MAG: hypothetical protein LBO21_01395 [Synergistaceae bacterium]|jgi:hypothetical protein|nr:hypothetical protein [Synergistaceae bacterium]